MILSFTNLRLNVNMQKCKWTYPFKLYNTRRLDVCLCIWHDWNWNSVSDCHCPCHCYFIMPKREKSVSCNGCAPKSTFNIPELYHFNIHVMFYFLVRKKQQQQQTKTMFDMYSKSCVSTLCIFAFSFQGVVYINEGAGMRNTHATKRIICISRVLVKQHCLGYIKQSLMRVCGCALRALHWNTPTTTFKSAFTWKLVIRINIFSVSFPLALTSFATTNFTNTEKKWI